MCRSLGEEHESFFVLCDVVGVVGCVMGIKAAMVAGMIGGYDERVAASEAASLEMV